MVIDVSTNLNVFFFFWIHKLYLSRYIHTDSSIITTNNFALIEQHLFVALFQFTGLSNLIRLAYFA